MCASLFLSLCVWIAFFTALCFFLLSLQTIFNFSSCSYCFRQILFFVSISFVRCCFCCHSFDAYSIVFINHNDIFWVHFIAHWTFFDYPWSDESIWFRWLCEFYQSRLFWLLARTPFSVCLFVCWRHFIVIIICCCWRFYDAFLMVCLSLLFSLLEWLCLHRWKTHSCCCCWMLDNNYAT